MNGSDGNVHAARLQFLPRMPESGIRYAKQTDTQPSPD